MAEEHENPSLVEGDVRFVASEENMDVEAAAAHDAGCEPSGIGDGGAKRAASGDDEDDDGVSKKPKIENSVEEDRLDSVEERQESMEAEKGEDGSEAPVTLGPKSFSSSLEMFDYFYKFLHTWPTNLDINKYEHMVILELIKKGHQDPGSKIGVGIQAFQVRYHPMWKSLCFFLLRTDGTSDDFSFRKCVDKILPLPDNMKPNPSANGGKHQKGSRGGRGGGSGRGRGSRGRK